MKAARSLLLPEPAIVAGLIVAFALVLGTILLSSFSTRAIVDANARATHAQRSLLAINQLLATTTEAEAAKTQVVNLINTFYRDRLVVMPTIKDYIERMQADG